MGLFGLNKKKAKEREEESEEEGTSEEDADSGSEESEEEDAPWRVVHIKGPFAAIDLEAIWNNLPGENTAKDALEEVLIHLAKLDTEGFRFLFHMQEENYPNSIILKKEVE